MGWIKIDPYLNTFIFTQHEYNPLTWITTFRIDTQLNWAHHNIKDTMMGMKNSLKFSLSIALFC